VRGGLGGNGGGTLGEVGELARSLTTHDWSIVLSACWTSDVLQVHNLQCISLSYALLTGITSLTPNTGRLLFIACLSRHDFLRKLSNTSK